MLELNLVLPTCSGVELSGWEADVVGVLGVSLVSLTCPGIGSRRTGIRVVRNDQLESRLQAEVLMSVSFWSGCNPVHGTHRCVRR